MPSSPTFYTVCEAAELLRVSERTLRTWIQRGDLTAVRLGARSPWRIPREVITRLAQGR